MIRLGEGWVEDAVAHVIGRGRKGYAKVVGAALIKVALMQKRKLEGKGEMLEAMEMEEEVERAKRVFGRLVEVEEEC